MNTLALIILVTWPYYLNDLYLISIGDSNLRLLWLLDVVFYTLIPVSTLVILWRKKLISKGQLGISKTIKFKNIALGLLLCLFTIISVRKFIEPWIYYYLPTSPGAGAYPFPDDNPWFLITITYAALSAGILEEIIFRGLLVSKLEENLKSKYSIIMASCLAFGLIHWCGGPAKIATTFVIALIPTIWFLRSRQVWGNMVFHASYNMLIYLKII